MANNGPFYSLWPGIGMNVFDSYGVCHRAYPLDHGCGRTCLLPLVVCCSSFLPGPSIGLRLITKTAYDNVGRVVKVSEPFLDVAKPALASSGLHAGAWSVVPRYSESVFNVNGQVASTWLKIVTGGVTTSKQLSENWYGLDWTQTVASPTGASTITYQDALGRMVSQQQTPETGKTGTPITTTYDYEVTAAGVTTTVTDAAGQDTVFVSDVAGRKVSMVDPNSGTSTYAYNVSGQVSQMVSATGTVTMTYDAAVNSVQARTSEVAPVTSEAFAGSAQGTATASTGPISVVPSGFVAANTQSTGTNFIVRPNRETIIVPNGASGPLPVVYGSGFQFIGGQGGYGLNLRVANVRIMDPKTTGPYTYPNGYVSYLNGATPRPQAVNPFTGQTVGKADPWWHWSSQP